MHGPMNVKLINTIIVVGVTNFRI